MEWSIQSTLTHFLAQQFDNLLKEEINNSAPFNDICNKLCDKLVIKNPTAFPQFGHYSAAAVDVLNTLYNDNEIGRQLTCITCKTSISHMFPNYFVSHL